MPKAFMNKHICHDGPRLPQQSSKARGQGQVVYYTSVNVRIKTSKGAHHDDNYENEDVNEYQPAYHVAISKLLLYVIIYGLDHYSILTLNQHKVLVIYVCLT